MDTNLESRVATLEERARAQSELNAHVSAKLDTIVAGIARLETMAALSSAKACPAPGKCLVLEDEGKRHAADLAAVRGEVEEMKRYIAEQRGGWKVLVAIAGAAGTCGSAITWVINHWHGKGGP